MGVGRRIWSSKNQPMGEKMSNQMYQRMRRSETEMVSKLDGKFICGILFD